MLLLAEAKPRPPLEAVLLEVPLEAVLLAAPLDADPPPRDELPFDAVLEAPLELVELPRFPPFEAVLEPVPFDAPPRAEDDDPPRLLEEDPPRLLEADPPWLLEEPPLFDEPLLAVPRDDEDLEAVLEAPLELPPLLAALPLDAVAPPRLADLDVEELLPPRFAAAVLPAAPRDEDEDLEAVFVALLEAPLELPPRLEDFEAAFDPPFEAAALLGALEALLLAPFDAVFEAALDVDRPPPLEACPPFFAAAFLVAFAMFNGFCLG